MRRDHPQTIEEEERRRMRLSILPVRDMMCSAFPVKGQMRKNIPEKGMAIARETEIEDAKCNARKGQEKHVRFKYC